MSKEKDSKITKRDKENEPSPELVEILKKAPKGAFELTAYSGKKLQAFR